jgi:hypothetical protein
MIDTIKCIDNFFPKLLHRTIINSVLEGGTVWHYQPNISYSKKDADQKAIDLMESWRKENSIMDAEAFVTGFEDNNIFKEMLKKQFVAFAKEKFETDINEILRFVLVYVPPNPNYNKNSFLYPHVDTPVKHKNILYYLNDNDADTIFFDQYFTDISSIEYRKLNVSHRVTPKENRAIMFDGHIFHAGNVSQSQKRLTLNLSFV